MLRKTAVTTLATTASPTREFAATFQDHLAHTLEDVVAHASELAHHCGRKRVQRRYPAFFEKDSLTPTAAR